ncbi:MAG: peroxiredoxin-like family protein [Pirellulales bacterium]
MSIASRVNQPAVDFRLTDAAGVEHTLSEYRGRWLWLVLHRHLACLLCREHVLELLPLKDQLERGGVSVAVVTFERRDVAARYAQAVGLSWPMLIDADRHLYRAYGMPVAPWKRLLGRWEIWKAYLRLVGRGRRVQLPTDDVHQLGGDIVIDPEGIVRLQHISVDPTDRPATADVLRLIGIG